MKKSTKEAFEAFFFFTGVLFWNYQICLMVYFIGKYFHLQGMLAAMGAQ